MQNEMPEIQCASRQREDLTVATGPLHGHANRGSSGKTRARPVLMNTPPPSPATAAKEKRALLNMEEMDAELLAGYHEASKVLLKRDDGLTPEDQQEETVSISQDSSQPGTANAAAAPRDSPEKRASTEQQSGKGHLSRSLSNDRRLNEAAQFFEAVGENPTTSLQEIIEDDNLYSDDSDESDDDEDSEGVLIEASKGADHGGSLGYEESRRKHSSSYWPLHHNVTKQQQLFHSLPGEVRPHNFEYKGIQSNPPEITKQGIQRGNYSQLHRKAWLEVSDKKHRYGKNLRLYYRHWESLGFPTNKFYDWLDSEGESEGQPKPEIPACSRSDLDSDTVLYISDFEITKGYALSIQSDDSGSGRILDADGEPMHTGTDGWIFVLRDNVMYGARKVTALSGKTKERFHHSSFFGGKAVSAAGILITNDDGILTQLFPHSGHYRPGEADMQRMLFYLYNQGVDLHTFQVDTQQLIHANREDVIKNGVKEKKKKIDSLHLEPAVTMAHYLSHKARFIGHGIFSEIHTLKE